MKVKLQLLTAVVLLGLSGTFLPLPVWANPWEQLGPSDPLYQRVRHLEVYGLLDSQDQAVLDQGKYVSRLELAFYTEKAKARLDAPQLGQPGSASPSSAPAGVPGLPTPETGAPMTVPPSTEAPGLPPPTGEAPALPPGTTGTTAPLPSSEAPAPPTGEPALPPPADNSVPSSVPPSVPGAAEVPPPSTEAPALPPPAPESAASLPNVPSSATRPMARPTPAPYYPPAPKREVDDLLKQLHEEAAMLRTRLSLYDTRIREQQDELDKLKTTQDEVDAIWKKANKSVGMPHFYENTSSRFENINVTGPLANGVAALNNPIRMIQQIDLGIYSDLGGKGTLSAGIGAVVPYTNASAAIASGVGVAPVSLYMDNPSATFFLYGDLGKWNTTFCVEAYQPDTTLGNFSRGFATYAIKRFEDPFDIKNFNDDKNAKNWDDYMTSVSYIPAYSPTAGNVQSSSDRVFDGMYAVGKDIPWLGPDGKMWLMVGRMGTSPTATQRWEQALKIDQPWANSMVRTAFSTEWVNDDFGVNQPVQLDMKDFEGDVKVNFDPVFLELDGALCDFYTGGAWSGPSFTSSTNPSTGQSYTFQSSSQGLEDYAGQVSVIFYPFTFYYFNIGANYADFQSRVMMSGLNFFHYGLSWNPSDFNDTYGDVAEADTLQSDRNGWRLNFGWNGRKQSWMKEWPSLLDDIVVNFDLAQKNESVAELSPMGYNVVEPFSILSFYYPDDEGLWGLNLWGNYAPNVNPLRQDYINNVEGLRNDGDIANDDVRYQFRLSSERLPLILPIYNNNGGVGPAVYSLTPLAPGQAIATYANGTNQYANLTDLKTFNYIALTTKFQLYKMMGIKTPIDASVYFTDNVVSGIASNAATNLTGNASGSANPSTFSASIPNLFEQVVWDANLMVNVLGDVNLMADIGQETWKSSYTYPLVDYVTNEFGLGFTYDIPWCGGKWDMRFKHIDFHDNYVSANNYQGDQVFSRLRFLF